MMKSLCGTLLGLVVLSMFPAHPADSLAEQHPAGFWQLADSLETRREQGSPRESWTVEGRWGRVTSQLVDEDARRPHRVEFTWSGPGDLLAPGVPCEVVLGTVILDAAHPATASLSIESWTSLDASARDAAPTGAAEPTAIWVDAGDPEGAAGLARAMIRVPAPRTDDPRLVGGLFVRVVVTHGGNTATYVRSYAWVSTGAGSTTGAD